MKHFILPCLLLISLFTSGQSSQEQKGKIDSLKAVIRGANHDSTIINAWRKWDLLIFMDDPKLDKKLLGEIMALSEANLATSNSSKEKAFFTKALWYGRYSIGYYHMHQGNYDIALSSQNEALIIAKEIGKLEIAQTEVEIGNIYDLQGFTQKAVVYWERAHDHAEEAGDANYAAVSLSNIAQVYARNKKYDEALSYCSRAIKLYEALGPSSRTRIGEGYSALGDIYLKMNDLKNARKHFNRSYKILDSLNLNLIALVPLTGLARLALIEDKYDEVELYSNKGLEISRPRNFTMSTRGFASMLSIAYKEQGKFGLALEMLELQLKSDSILNSENNKKTIIEYEFKLKATADSLSSAKKQAISDAGLEKQKAELKMKEIQQYGLYGGISLLLVFIVFGYNRFRLTKRQNVIIEREKLKAEKQKRNAEQSEAFKQQFLANMSHEIRTPMNAVMGMTNLVLDTPLKPKQKDYMEGIKKSSDNLLHIINDILDLSKIEAGKMELEQIDFSLSDTVDQLKQTLKHRATDKGLELVTSIKSNVSDIILGDPVRLNQVLINLTGNAIKFTEKGSVAIEVTKVVEGVKFAIVDTGIGIPADKLESVFENFSQANASDTRKFGGTGLGLSISRQLVELMGGDISIESEEGFGTTFSFIINFKEGSEDQLEQRMALEHSVDGTILDGLKILITDDNEYNRIVARDTLKSKANVEIFEAENGQKAIDLLMDNDFDVILMDVQMPVMNGFDATANIRTNFDAPKKDTPIIALTASVLRTDLDKCTNAGMDSYIPKPFKPQELIVGIAQVLNIELRAAKKEEKNETKPEENTIKGDSVTDMTFLRDFCNGDKEKMAKYISMFTSTAPILIDKIKMAVKDRDFNTIANQVHGFKTKWIMMGMTETKDMGNELENLCREEPENSTIDDKLLGLTANVESAIRELS